METKTRQEHESVRRTMQSGMDSLCEAYDGFYTVSINRLVSDQARLQAFRFMGQIDSMVQELAEHPERLTNG